MDKSEKILICLSGAPTNAKVVRTGAALADAFGGGLCALYVEPPDFERQPDESKARLNDNIRLAERLGASVTTLYGEDAATQIAEYARICGATKIVLGKSNGKKGLFSPPTLIERLNELAPDIDLYIIPDKVREGGGRPRRGDEHFSLPDVLIMLGIIALCTLIGFGFSRLNFDSTNVIIIYILGVLATAIFTSGRSYSLISSLLSVLVFNFFFASPYFSLLADPNHLATFVIMFFAAFLISSLTTKIKRQSVLTAQRAYRTEVLLETSQKLQKADGIEQMLSVTARQLGKLFERDIMVYPVENGSLSEPLLFPLAEGSDFSEYLTDSERTVAEWVLENNRRAGSTTRISPKANGLYMAVRGTDSVLAVVCIAMKNNSQPDSFEKTLSVTILDECGLIMENAENKAAKHRAEEEARREQLQANLLRSISHDLRTPLTGISGNASLLSEGGDELTKEQKNELYSAIAYDAQWLTDLVENLLSITRIGSGGGLNIQPELVADVISEALHHVDRQVDEHSVTSETSDELIMAFMDARLIKQVIINIVNNAIKYTPAGSHIKLTSYAEGKFAKIKIADDGAGISEQARAKIFDMFYTEGNANGDGRRGLGLGLYLCRSIAEAHGGSITVSENSPHGAAFELSIPLAEVRAYE